MFDCSAEEQERIRVALAKFEEQSREEKRAKQASLLASLRAQTEMKSCSGLLFSATVTAMCAQRNGAAASVERRRCESAMAISPK